MTTPSSEAPCRLKTAWHFINFLESFKIGRFSIPKIFKASKLFKNLEACFFSLLFYSAITGYFKKLFNTSPFQYWKLILFFIKNQQREVPPFCITATHSICDMGMQFHVFITKAWVIKVALFLSLTLPKIYSLCITSPKFHPLLAVSTLPHASWYLKNNNNTGPFTVLHLWLGSRSYVHVVSCDVMVASSNVLSCEWIITDIQANTTNRTLISPQKNNFQ